MHTMASFTTPLLVHMYILVFMCVLCKCVLVYMCVCGVYMCVCGAYVWYVDVCDMCVVYGCVWCVMCGMCVVCGCVDVFGLCVFMNMCTTHLMSLNTRCQEQLNLRCQEQLNIHTNTQATHTGYTHRLHTQATHTSSIATRCDDKQYRMVAMTQRGYVNRFNGVDLMVISDSWLQCKLGHFREVHGIKLSAYGMDVVCVVYVLLSIVITT